MTRAKTSGHSTWGNGGPNATPPARGGGEGRRGSLASLLPVSGALRRGTRASVALVLALAVIVANAQLASADVVTNDLTVAGSATITAGGKTTVGYQVLESPGNSDGQRGCNAADGSALSVTVAVPTGASAASASFTPGTTKLTFTSCSVYQYVEFSSNTPGSYSITHTLSDSNSSGGYTNSANFTLTVNPAPITNTAPKVSVTGVVHGTSYEFGNVPAANCKVEDKEDGTKEFAASLDLITGARAADGLGSQTATCNYTDAGGLSASASATYSIVDTTPPAVTVPKDVTAEATSASGAAVTYTGASALDAVDGTIVPTCTPASGSTFKLGATTVTCEARDKAGNLGSKAFAVNVKDTTAPSVDVPDNLVEEATSSAGAKVTFTVAATDLVSGSLTPSCMPASGSTFAFGTTTVTCKATDGAGNTGTNSFDIKVQDSTKPDVTVPKDIIIEATSASGAVVTYSGVSAHDTVDGAVTPTCDKASGATYGLGEHTVTCKATDSSNNTGTNSFTITVKDTTAPVVTVPGNITAEATSALGAAVNFSVSASDAVSGSPKVKCTRGTGPNATVESGASFALGTTTVTCSATDGAGNTGTKMFTVTVQDTTTPVVTVPADITAEATSDKGAPVEYSIDDATDAVSGAITPACTKASGTVFALGTTTVTCSATDGSGNTGTTSFEVTVRDTTPPVVQAPANVVEEATSADGAHVKYTGEKATDAVTLNPVVSCTPKSESLFPLGSTTVTCSATDGAGNLGTDTFIVKVQDSTKPDVVVPADQTVEATSALGAVVSYMGVSASDLVDGPLTATCDKKSGDRYPLGATTVTCSATDKAGNNGSNSFTITVKDTTAPVVSVPANIAATANSAAGAVVSYASATAIDTVSGTVPAACDIVSGSSFGPGVTTVTCKATDAAGNVGQKSFTVTVTYNWSNFLQPINADGSSIFKLGSTVPVKFKLGGASAPVTNLAAHLSYRKVTSGVLGSEMEAASTAAADSGNTFRFDATSGQYIFNLSSKALTGGDGTYELRVDCLLYTSPSPRDS